MRILQSASKVVFVLFALTSCASFMAVVISNITSEQVIGAASTVFTTAVGSAMTYYFTKKGNESTAAQGSGHAE